MRKFKAFLTLITVFLCAVVAFGVTACAESGITLKLKQDSVTVEIDKSTLIGATIEGTDITVNWEIEDPEIASITVIGKSCSVKGLKVGTTKLIASVGEIKAECEVIVIDKKPVEEVTIKLDGEPITETTLDKGENKTLTAEGSLGSAITSWKSSNEKVVTVDNGVLTGVEYGIATVTAQISASVKAEIEVTVKPASSAEDNFYLLKFAEEDGAKVEALGDASEQAGPDEYFYWGGKFVEFGYAFQEVTVEHAYHKNGVVDIKYTCDTEDGRWEGFQLFYKNSEHTLNNYYKLDCKINVSVDCKVTLNGNVIDLTAGDNTVSVYYQYTSGSFAGEKYGISSFDLTMGYNDGSEKGKFVQNADIKISDVSWTDDTATRIKLNTPSFTYAADTGIITITDTNTVGVSGYVLNLYKGTSAVGNIIVKSGEKVDLSEIDNGTYTAKLVAVASNAHYINSNDSTESIEITVNNEGGASYELQNNNTYACTAHPGKWTYWSESWVVWNKKEYKGGVVTLDFSNNTGNWYDTQIFYKNPTDEIGKYYTMSLTISAPNAGRVTVNGKVITFKEGSHDYTFNYLATDKASIQILFGVNGENNKQEISAGTVTIKLNSVTEAVPEKLKTPSFTYDADTKVITITDPNTAGVTGYRLNLYNGETLAGYIPVENGKAVDFEKSTAKNGDYVAKLIAIGDGAVNLDSDPSENSVNITIANEKTLIKNGDEKGAIATPKEWIEWHDQNYNGSNVTLTEAYIDKDGAVHVTYSGAVPKVPYGLQLFWYDNTLTVGSNYVVTMKINASVAGVITINKVEKALVVGDNEISVVFAHPAIEDTSWGGQTGATISMQFGSNVTGNAVIAAGTFVLSDVAVNAAGQATKLTAPSYEYNAETGIITITDPNEAGVARYELKLYQGEEVKATVVVENGKAVDLSSVENGTYKAYILAVADGVLYENSDLSENGVDITVANATTKIIYGEEDKYTEGWRYWDSKAAADWNQWTAANCTSCLMDEDGTITLVYTCEGTGANWAMQMFYKVADGAAMYNVTLSLTSSVDTTAVVCGKEVVLKAGVKQTVTAEGYKSNKGSAIQISFGIKGGTFTLSDISVTAVTATKLATPSYTYNAETGVITITDSNEAGVGSYKLNLYNNDGEKAASVTVKNGEKVSFGAVASGEYTAKLVAVGANALYTDSDESEGTAVTVVSTGTPVPFGAVGVALENKEKWYYWNEASMSTVSACYLEGDDLHISFTTNGGTVWYAVQLFYAMNVGEPTCSFKLNINSSVDCRITINQKVVELKAGNNDVSVDFSGALKEIQFGVNSDYMVSGGEFVFSNMRFEAIVATKLEVPSFTLENNVITITDPNEKGVKEFQLYFYQGEEEKGHVKVESGKEISVAGLAVGEYTVKLVAVGDGVHFSNSDFATCDTKVTVETAVTTVPLGVGDIGAAQNDKGKWYAWYDTALVNVTKAETDTETGAITITFEYKDANNRPWYAMRLARSVASGAKQYIQMDITVEADCKMTICNNVVELKAGANHIVVEAKTGADVIIAFGEDPNPGAPAGTYIISNIEYTDPPATT